MAFGNELCSGPVTVVGDRLIAMPEDRVGHIRCQCSCCGNDLQHLTQLVLQPIRGGVTQRIAADTRQAGQAGSRDGERRGERFGKIWPVLSSRRLSTKPIRLGWRTRTSGARVRGACSRPMSVAIAAGLATSVGSGGVTMTADSSASGQSDRTRSLLSEGRHPIARG